MRVNVLAVLILSVVVLAPVTSAIAGPPPKVPKSTPKLLEKGIASYATNCQVCHGPKGDGMVLLERS
jgi:mono/diheme cytochrome c family protein